MRRLSTINWQVTPLPLCLMIAALALLSSCTSDRVIWSESLFSEGFSEGLGKARHGMLWGFVDRTGNFAIPPKYLSVAPFHDGYAAVKRRNGFGFIDIKDKPFVPIENAFAFPYSNERAAFLQKTRVGLKWGYLDKDGFPIISPAYGKALPFSADGYAAVRQNARWGFIDRSGKVVVPLKYRAARHFSGGVAPVNLKGQWGYVDGNGDLVIPPAFDDAYPFAEGIAAVLKHGRWGFIDRRGDWAVRPTYVNVQSFSEGLAAVQYVNGKWGFIDSKGTFVIHPKYDLVKSFTEGFAAVNMGTTWGASRNGGFLPMIQGSWGYLDKTGKLVKDFEYVQASPFTDGAARVRIGDKLAYVDKTFVVFWVEEEPKK